MKITRIISLVLVSAVCCVLPALGQIAPAPEHTNTMVDLIKGKLAPLTIHVKDMDRQWLKLTVSPRLGGMDNLLALMINDGKPGAPAPPCFTRGQVLTIDGVSYLAIYSLPQDAQPALLTAESMLTLSLLNMRTLTNMFDIRPFNLEQELREGMQVQQLAQEQRLRDSLTQIRQLATAVQMYSQDNAGKLPPMKEYADFKAAIKQYLGGAEQLFINPLTGKPYQVNTALNGLNEAHIVEPTVTVALYEGEPGPDNKHGVGFMDGHSERVTKERLAELLKNAGVR